MTISIPQHNMPFADDVISAQECWNAGQAELFEFAIHCHSIVGKRNGETERLARAIHRSVDTVERYAKGGTLWLAMLARYPSESELLRDAMEISFWNDVGRLFASDTISLSGAKHWLEEAKENSWTVEKLRTMLPNKTGVSTIRAKAIRAANFLENEIVNAPALGVDEHVYKITHKLVKVTVTWLRKLAEVNK